MQFLYGSLFDEKPYIKLEREEMGVVDGGKIALDWTDVDNRYDDNEKTKILLLCHGINGAGDSSVMT